MKKIFLVLTLMVAITKADYWTAESACNFQVPECTQADRLRQWMWRGFQVVDNFPCGQVELLKRVNCIPEADFLVQLRNAPGIVACIVDEMELYRPDDCSEMGQLRTCIWNYIKNKEWGKQPPRSFRRVLASVTEKDYVVPSDSVLEDLSYYVDEKYLPKCLYEAFTKVRYCHDSCPVCVK